MNKYPIERKHKIALLQILATGKITEEQAKSVKECLNLNIWGDSIVVDMETGKRWKI